MITDIVSFRTVKAVTDSLMAKHPDYDQAKCVEAIEGFFKTRNEARHHAANDKLYWFHFPDEFEKFAGDEDFYALLCGMYEDAFNLGFRCGISDLEDLLNQCDNSAEEGK